MKNIEFIYDERCLDFDLMRGIEVADVLETLNSEAEMFECVTACYPETIDEIISEFGDFQSDAYAYTFSLLEEIGRDLERLHLFEMLGVSPDRVIDENRSMLLGLREFYWSFLKQGAIWKEL